MSVIASLAYLGLSSGFTETMMNDRMGKYLVTLQVSLLAPPLLSPSLLSFPLPASPRLSSPLFFPPPLSPWGLSAPDFESLCPQRPFFAPNESLFVDDHHTAMPFLPKGFHTVFLNALKGVAGALARRRVRPCF